MATCPLRRPLRYCNCHVRRRSGPNTLGTRTLGTTNIPPNPLFRRLGTNGAVALRSKERVGNTSCLTTPIPNGTLTVFNSANPYSTTLSLTGNISIVIRRTALSVAVRTGTGDHNRDSAHRTTALTHRTKINGLVVARIDSHCSSGNYRRLLHRYESVFPTARLTGSFAIFGIWLYLLLGAKQGLPYCHGPHCVCPPAQTC